ncbi:hypothetical protein K4K56_000861 [Colletotrichum sp. SAR 10_98]|nr:hypothetical protein K4K56_000861 [Colletotrichum sp. SAR 10_98]
MSDRLAARREEGLRRALPPEVFILIIEAFLDEVESSTASQSWLISVIDSLGDPFFYLGDYEPARDDCNKLQRSRFLKIRSVSQVNQMTQTMVRNRFSPLPCWSALQTAARVLVFPKIDYMVLLAGEPLVSIESALSNQLHHTSRFLQSIDRAIFLGGIWSLCEEPKAIKCLVSMFPKLKVMLLPTHWENSFPRTDRSTGHDHDEVLLLSSDVFLYPTALEKLEFGPVSTTLKPLWEKQVRLVGTARFAMAAFSKSHYLAQARSLGPAWTVIFYGVPLTNIAIHIAWLLALHPALASIPLPFSRQRLRDFLNKNFMLRPSNLQPITLITSAFSHIQPLHLFVNMSTYSTYVKHLYARGTSPLRFVLLALGSGIAASAAFVWNSQRQRPRKTAEENTAVGASGVLTGLGIALAAMYPAMRVRLSGTNVVLSLREVSLAMFAVDVFCLGTQTETGVGHAGHIGGALFGLLYALGRKWLGYRNL